jgi:hypothetical protein
MDKRTRGRGPARLDGGGEVRYCTNQRLLRGPRRPSGERKPNP